MSETYNNLQLQVDHLRSQRQRFEKTKHSLAGNLKSESIGMETKINSSEACTLETRVGTTKLRNRDDWGSGPFDGASYDYDIAHSNRTEPSYSWDFDWNRCFSLLMAPRIPARKRQRRPHRGDSYRSRELQSDPIDAPQFNSQPSPANKSLSISRPKFKARKHASRRPRRTPSHCLDQPPVPESFCEPHHCVQLSQRQLSNPVSPRTPDPRLTSPLGNSLRTPTPNISRVRTSAPRPPCPHQSQAMNMSTPSEKAPPSSEKTPSSPGLLSAQPSLLLLSLPRSSTPVNLRSVPLPISPIPIEVNKSGTPVAPKRRSRRLSFGDSLAPGQQFPIDESNKPEIHFSDAVHKSLPSQYLERKESSLKDSKSSEVQDGASPECGESESKNLFRFRGSSVFSENDFSPKIPVDDKQMGTRHVVRVFQESHMFTPKSTLVATEALERITLEHRETNDRPHSRMIVTEHEITDGMDCEQEKHEIESVSTAPPSPVLGVISETVENGFESDLDSGGVSSGVFCRPLEVSIPGGALRSPSVSGDSDADQQFDNT